MQVSIKEVRIGLRPSRTRIPFRYGKVCLTVCPQLIYEVTLETDLGRFAGFSGDCLPPGWFDKRAKPFEKQIEEMLEVIESSTSIFLEEFREPTPFFGGWLSAYRAVQQQGVQQDLTELLASFAVSLPERAMIDAICRAANVSLFDALQQDVLGIEPGLIHPVLAGGMPRNWLPVQPLAKVWVRHTVGLGDPLTLGDVPGDERLDDGLSQTLEDHVKRSGVKYFKIKINQDIDESLDRVRNIGRLVEMTRGADYRVTLDGNEQFESIERFTQFVHALRSDAELMTLWSNTLLIEQPISRGQALQPELAAGLRELNQLKPVIIDESDGTLQAYAQAIELGYGGTSIKNCKGPIKSLLNLGLTCYHNERVGYPNYLMTGEDLCSLGVIPVQADLCLTSALGIRHVERNGHHFHPGLSYLTDGERQQALAHHGDFYTEVDKGDTSVMVAPRVNQGQLDIGSLQCVGFGFDFHPDFKAMVTPEEWNFATLGIDDD